MTAQDQKATPRQRLMDAGAELFSKNGYGGASVREICELAGVSSNMIHHYFGNKRGLYDVILTGFSEEVFSVPARVISKAPKNRESLVLLLEIFFEETFEVLINHRAMFELAVRERMVFTAFLDYSKQLIKFLELGKAGGLIRQELDSEMLTGLIMDRIGNQILFASWIVETSGHDVISDVEYRKRWTQANLDLIFHGILV